MKPTALRLFFIVFALGSWLACAGCHITPDPNPPPYPDVVDAGPAPIVDAAPPVDAPAPFPCTGYCCPVCSVLTAHGCPEARPTALGHQCTEVCQNAANGPAVAMRWPDVSRCSTIACVRAPGANKRGIGCVGGH